VCQSQDKATQKKLGKLVDVIKRTTSVGGLPDRGVPEAIALIKQAMTTGATWYVRSDLKNFFQAVPKDKVRDFLKQNVNAAKFNSLFMDALSTELSNEDEVRDLMRLFPTGPVGVPQGSALSALSDFDLEFNLRGITTIRYLDDFVMLGKGKKATEAAFKAGEKLLAKSDFQCHDPFTGGSKKASAGIVAEGFEFLSFKISPTSIVPTRIACADFLDDIKSEIESARSDIQSTGSGARRAEPRYTQTLGLLDRKIRGWGDAFRPTTERLIFGQLDDKISEELEKFQGWFLGQTKKCDLRRKRRALGVALLFDTPSDSP
jgi:hypothetical protein